MAFNAADVTLIRRMIVGLPINPAQGGAKSMTIPKAASYVAALEDNAGAQDETVPVPVSISDLSGFAGCTLVITFDQTALEVVGVSTTPATTGFSLDWEVTGGALRILLAASEALVSGSGAICTIDFHVRPSAIVGDTALNMAEAKLSGEHGEDLSWRSNVTVADAIFIVLAQAGGDVWVVFRPNETWYLEDLITLSAGATTVDGERVASDTYRFRVESEQEYQARTNTPDETIWQPRHGEDFEAGGLDLSTESSDTVTVISGTEEAGAAPLVTGVDALFTIGPERVYDTPQRVWLPVPEGIDPNEVWLYYYHPNGEDRGWYLAENVQGWLVADSYLQVEVEGTTYLGFLVRHAGIVQLGRPVE